MFKSSIEEMQNQTTELRKSDWEQYNNAIKEYDSKIDKLSKSEADLFQELQRLVEIVEEKQGALKK